ncbi:Hypothetical predicted protein [Olea europaea subsp. europaea]|uniref:Uncharacterized protein n=1 Tax=Olea europaea subsp. europaea TaxID=158383 RepID=A0A8S0PY73_OLEEU|nr:Hypothetical predicted protein [Olea europaea subsp. europaea]
MESGFPLTRIEPDMVHPVLFDATAERNVVFPAPDGPMTADILPGKNFPVTLLIRCLCFFFKVMMFGLLELLGNLGGSDESLVHQFYVKMCVTTDFASL